MDIRSLQLILNKEDRPSFYIVSGDDEFLCTEVEESLKASFQLSENQNIEMYYGDQIDYEACLDSLNTLPFFSVRKVVIIKNAEKLKSTFLEELNEIFAGGDLSDLVLVLFFSKMDKRKKITKSLLKKSYHVEIKTPYDSQINSWVSYMAQKKGKTITTDACAQLNFLVGPSLIEISKSVEEITITFDEKKITKEHVQEIVSKTRVSDVFKICDLLGRAEFADVSVKIESALKEGASSIGILNLFFRHFRILEGILEGILENSKEIRIGQKELAAKVGVPPYFLRNYQEQSRQWSFKKLRLVFKVLEAADLSLKSTGLSEKIIFSGLIMEISRIFGEKRGLKTLTEVFLSR